MKKNHLPLLAFGMICVLAGGCNGDDPAVPGHDSGEMAVSADDSEPLAAVSFLQEIASSADGAEIFDDGDPGWWRRRDMPGTARGCWFRAGEDADAADPHLILFGSDAISDASLIACGPDGAALDPGAYAYDSRDAGRYNRPFSAVTPDGNTYAVYLDLWVDRTILLHMPDDETLWIEAFDGPPGEPAGWSFTSGKAIFVR